MLGVKVVPARTVVGTLVWPTKAEAFAGRTVTLSIRSRRALSAVTLAVNFVYPELWKPTGNVPVMAPAGMVIVAGTVTHGSLLDRPVDAPPAGAGAEMFTL